MRYLILLFELLAGRIGVHADRNAFCCE